ncbi:MAG: VWA domain-containing protein [Kiritimatiellae bacterium]|nr:VWA domain-containing protein [Kiritimatiellia bacterium]
MEKTRQIFEKEWAIHREGGAWTSFTADAGKARANGDFDADPKEGEIRIFADMKRPFVALLAEKRGAAGWLIVPVSPFTVPASAREILVGERVFQLWNACTAAKGFVERSWRVDALDAADVAELKEAVKEANPGRITAGDGVVAEYEREYLVAGGSFEPVLAEKPRDARPRPLWIRIVRLSSLAAVLAIGFGVIYFGANNFGARRVKPATEIYYDDNLLLDEACYSAPSEPSAPVEQAETAICRKPVAKAICRKPATKAKYAMNAEKSIMPVPAAAAIPMADFDMAPSSFERYAEFNENEFQDAKSNPLSTFSLDVDTTSYALMRREIVEYKRLPVPHMVRLEEFVNYFRYDYAEPKDGDPIAVDCEMAPCPWNKNHRLARIALQAKRVEKDKIPPCNLTFLIDVSGSMDWNGGMAMVKKGLSLLVDELRDEDSVAIVTYANGTSVRLPSTPGSKKRKILSVIDSLMAGGATAGGAGIQLAYDEAKKNFDKARNNRVILITDGDFNIGISSPKELEDFIAAKRDSGVFLTVLGVGDGNYNDAMMKKLANAGNGNYAYIDSVLEAKKIMMDEFGGTLQTVAKDVKLQIEFNPAQVAGYRLLGYENRRLENKDFNDDRKDAGEIGSGHTMTAFYEIVPAGSGEAVADVDPLKYQKQENVGSDEAFTVKLRWKEPDGDKSLLREIPCTEAAITRKEATEDFRFASAVAEFALILERSKFKGDASFKSVLERARAAKGKDAEGYRAEFIRIVEAAELYSGK